MKKISKKQMIIIICVALIVIAVIATATVLLRNSKKSKARTNTIPEIQSIVSNRTTETQEQMNLENVEIKSMGSSIIATGNIKNLDELVKKCTLTLNVYNEKEQLKGSQNITIENLGSQESKEFEITIIGDYIDLKNYEIVVQNVER